MDTGQISLMPANAGMPTGGAQPSSLAALLSEQAGQAGVPFAGLLDGAASQKASQGAASVSGKGVQAPDKDGETPTTAVQDGMTGVTAGVLNARDASGKQLATGMDRSAEASATVNRSGRKPQDVVPDADGLGMALLTQVIGGRMPQAGDVDIPASADTLDKKPQDVVLTADREQPSSLLTQVDGGRTPQADGTVMQQSVAASMADSSVTSLSNNGGVPGIVTSTSADAVSLLNLAATATTPSEAASKGNQPQYASQKEPDRTTLPAVPSPQVSAIVEQQNLAVVNGTASTELGAAASNQNGIVNSTVSPVAGTPGPGKGGAEVRTAASSGVEVTAQPQQEVPLFRSASIEVALAESAPLNVVRATGQTQDIRSATSGPAQVAVTLSPASSQQPAQSATTNNSALDVTNPVQPAVVSAAEKMGMQAIPPEGSTVPDNGKGSASGATAPASPADAPEVRTTGQAQDAASAQDAPVAEIPAASTAQTSQAVPQQAAHPANPGVMVQVALSPAASQEPNQAVTANYHDLEGTRPAQASVVPVAGKTSVEAEEEVEQVQPGGAAAAKPVQGISAEAVKFAGAGSSGGEFSPGDDKGAADNHTNSQFHAALMHQQGSTDAANAAGSVSTPVQNNVQQSGLSEQITQQVRDRLVNHDLKAGNDQITLRLSPEDLGDLKVNLTMDGQRLKVEIVADNHMVRDALLQNTGSLKESLARQNISMESFDVTTDSRGAGNYGQGQQQNGWREFAQQRQQNAWMSSGGYRLPDTTTVPGKLAYQTPSQHSMVDLHF